MAVGSIELCEGQKSLHFKTNYIKLELNGRGKYLKRFKGVGRNPKAKIIVPYRELKCSRGFSAELDMSLNLVLFS